MIALLKGKVEYSAADYVIISSGGVGFQVFMPTSNLSNLYEGKEATVFTHLHVREDALTLFGFSSEAELAFFRLLTSVSGLGPKLALALLSQKDIDSLKLAIAAGDVKALSTVSGVGKKTAERMCLELKDKVGGIGVSLGSLPSAQDEVIDALLSLGYSSSEAASAVMQLSPEERSGDISSQITAVLRYMGSD